MRAIAFVLLTGLCASVVSQLPPPTSQDKRRLEFWKSIGNTYDDLYRAAAQVKPHQPVDDLQAELLASAYFSAYVSGCGCPEAQSDKGNYWLFKTKVGVSASPGPEIRVEKSTGVTSSKGRPTVHDPGSYAKRVRR